MSSKPKVARVCLCGTGRIGTVHTTNILSIPTIKIVAVVEVLEDRCKEFSEGIGAKGYATLDEALADESNPFTGVLVCTPTSTHTEVARTAILAGKHVFCEKPVSHHLEDADALFALAHEMGVILLCAFQRRYDKNFRALRNAVHDGTLGKLHKIRSISRDNPRPPASYLKTSGGIFHDCVSHDIDVLRWVVGEDPIEVFCAATSNFDDIKEVGDFDTVECIFRFPSGVIGTIDVSRQATYAYDQRIDCLGENGMVTANNIHDTTVIIANKNGYTASPNVFSFPERYVLAYKEEIVHFANLLNGTETVPIVQFADVHNNAIIAEALGESARTNKPVKLTNLVSQGRPKL